MKRRTVRAVTGLLCAALLLSDMTGIRAFAMEETGQEIQMQEHSPEDGTREEEDEKTEQTAAKAAFNALGKKPLPKAAQLSEEYAALLAKKKACYEEYKAARKEMIEYRNAKQNVDQILGVIKEQEKDKETER